MKKSVFIVLFLAFLLSATVGLVGCEDIPSSAHTHEFTKKVVADRYLASEATCKAEAKYYYSCECGEKGTETFDNGGKLPHSFNKQVVADSYLASPATCSEGAKYYYSCECGEHGSETFTSGSGLGHKFTNYASDNNATCTHDGTKTATCDHDGCNETDTIKDEGSRLPHSFNKQVVADSYLASEATCTEKAKYYYSCECGEYSSDTFECGETKAHTEVIDKGFAATRTTNGLTDGKHCSECGAVLAKQEVIYATGSVGLSYETNIDEKTDTITGIGSCTDGAIVIPKYSPKGNLITSIGKSAFAGQDRITSIEIPDSIQTIEHRAFAYCSGLSEIIIPNSVMTVGDYAFSACTGLTSVIIGGSVSYIGENAFSSCVRLTNLSIPKSITIIGDYAFKECYGLVKIAIPNVSYSWGILRVGSLLPARFTFPRALIRTVLR